MMMEAITILMTVMMIMMVVMFKIMLVIIWCTSTRVDVYIFKKCIPTDTLSEVITYG